MADYSKHLYCLLFPNSALIASQLKPKDFGRHYAIGYPKNYKGKVVFAEIDVNYRNPYFDIENVLAKDCVSKPDGSPKRTKFLSSYRVIEHIDESAFKSMYLVTRSGRILELPKHTEYDLEHEKEKMRIYQLMAPLYYLIASNLTPPKFGRYVSTEPHKGVPRSAMCQIDIDIERILNMSDEEIFYASPLPSVHPGYLRKSLVELQNSSDKRTKTISLNEIFDYIPFIKIKHGIWINSKDTQIFYPMPTQKEFETKYYEWWKDASM